MLEIVVDIFVVTLTHSEWAINVPKTARYNRDHQSVDLSCQSVRGKKKTKTTSAKKNWPKMRHFSGMKWNC